MPDKKNWRCQRKNFDFERVFMKKRVVLIVLLAAVAVMAFAQAGRNIPFDVSGDSRAGSVWITRCQQSAIGVNIAYSCRPANSLVEVDFTFTAHYEDGSTKTWTNHESWLKSRDDSTWYFTVMSPSKITRMYISWKRTNPSLLNP